MESAFGIDHGDQVSKGLKDLAQGARLQAKAGKASFKLGRAHKRKALADAGYPTKWVAQQKEGFKAGMRGSGRHYNEGIKAAGQAARKRTMADIADASRGVKPGSTLGDPGAGDQAVAGFRRNLSQRDWRLK